MKTRRNFLLFTCTFLLLIFISPITGVFWAVPAQAVCVTVLGREVCHQDLDPTQVIPGSAEIAEQAWGEAGSTAYQAAARIMRERNGSGQGLDETQKRFLRQRYGGLVDQVRVAYLRFCSSLRNRVSCENECVKPLIFGLKTRFLCPC
ncbi:hypothetical protein K9N68_34055 (plasmid) [Kovacikia minuta CCNUW1]|uniref:hypothetical protein n=1 Tax=Kovacikia minuta TaxID=2931930 RepID=UPI001CCAE294|nr:hypothetical protein [Kovacikia minuta]UBF30246.1 hypothetical protein K9N68_34055 [Kovacikia minuta CCNUW1]